MRTTRTTQCCEDHFRYASRSRNSQMEESSMIDGCQVYEHRLAEAAAFGVITERSCSCYHCSSWYSCHYYTRCSSLQHFFMLLCDFSAWSFCLLQHSINLCMYIYICMCTSLSTCSCMSWTLLICQAINRLRETLDELTVQKKGIKPEPHSTDWAAEADSVISLGILFHFYYLYSIATRNQ